MPLYEYQCDACSNRFERIQKFSDPLVTECPTCGGSVHKLLSSPAIQFKGAGWYVTDYAKSGSSGKKESSGDKPASSSADSSSSSSSSSASEKSSGADAAKKSNSKPDGSK